MIDLRLDMRHFERKAQELNGALDQVPFAIANALNTAVFAARKVLVTETWPGAVTVRDKRFLSAVLRVDVANKRRLVVEIYDSTPDQRAHLGLHARGGVKRAKKRLAIPPAGTVRRTARGVAKADTPRAIIQRTPKRALRITPRGIFVGEGGRLKMRYSFHQAARQPADVPFHEDFRDTMVRRLRVEFPKALRKAMRTRRR